MSTTAQRPTPETADNPTLHPMNLTDEEIWIKVAEACGWVKQHHTVSGRSVWRKNGEFATGGWADHWFQELPNYPADLNACAEFEKTLTDEEHLRYRVRLWNVVITEGDETTWDRQFISATARQRCLAFLKTKGIIP